MRGLVLAAMMLATPLVGCSPTQPEKPAELPTFSFRKMVSGVTTLDAAKEAGTVWNCKPATGTETDEAFCELKGEAAYPEFPKLADYRLPDTFVTFEHGIWRGFIFEYSSNHFAGVTEALKQAYGEPCRADSEVLQNGFGAQFSGDSLDWCFKDGTLTLTRHMKSNYRHGELAFEKNGPPAPPKPAYKPDTL